MNASRTLLLLAATSLVACASATDSPRGDGDTNQPGASRGDAPTAPATGDAPSSTPPLAPTAPGSLYTAFGDQGTLAIPHFDGVSSIVDDGKGGLLVGDDVRVAHIDAKGQLDTAYGVKVLWAPYAAGKRVQMYAATLARQPDGGILWGGSAMTPSSDPSPFDVAAIRLDATYAGPTWLVGAKFSAPTSRAAALGVASDGSFVLAAGASTSASDAQRNKVYVATFSGSGVTTGVHEVDLGRRLEVTCAAMQDDGKVIVGGRSLQGAVLARLGSDGTLDPTFGQGGIVAPSIPNMANELRVLGDGTILVGAVARLAADGTRDSSFTPLGADGAGHRVAAAWQADGKIVAAWTPSSQSASVGRLLPTGALDSSFAGGIVRNLSGTNTDTITGIGVASSGLILVGGQRTPDAGDAHGVILAVAP